MITNWLRFKFQTSFTGKQKQTRESTHLCCDYTVLMQSYSAFLRIVKYNFNWTNQTKHLQLANYVFTKSVTVSPGKRNQPTDQPTKGSTPTDDGVNVIPIMQLTDQPIHQAATNQPISQPTKLSTNQATNQPTKQPTKQPVDLTMKNHSPWFSIFKAWSSSCEFKSPKGFWSCTQTQTKNYPVSI